ncbi:MAG: msbA [Gammaproteobacteria bacterium]|jgi:subfamily B ATP-binding cassette protein MsbA|nr:msbA [Gammaproteobacteria bacterium]
MKNFDFQKHKHLHVYFRLLLFSKQYWFALILGLGGNILAAAANASFTGMLKPVLDKGFIARDMHFIKWLPLIVFGAFLIRGVANFIGDYYMAWVGRQVVMRFRQEIFYHLLKLPADFYDQTSSGKLLSTIIYNVDQLAKASTDAVVTVVQESCFVIGLIVVMFINSWQLSLIYIVAVPIIALTARYASKRMRRLSKNLQASMGETTHIAQEAIDGYQVIRIFGGQTYEYEKFKKVTEQNRSREVKVTATNSIAGGLVQQVAGIAIAVIVSVATLSTSHITAGGFAAMLAAMLAILKPMKNLTNVSSTIQKGIAAAESIFDLLDTPTETDTSQKVIHNPRGELVFEQVSFQYPNSHKKILSDLSFTIPAGKITAIVGRSGAGKSTLVKLIPHFYSQYEGKILLDGTELQAISLASLREQIALVSQNITLFNDTIANNIAYGSMSKASREDIERAAKAAFADDFIQHLPQKYDTLIGDDGILLSGGQRQRLAIARAILKNAPILILDEATSALDSESEYFIQEALADLTKNRTTIVIAHRLSTIENADQILVLDHGTLVECGVHEELLAHGSYYTKLHRMQFKQE